MKNESYGSSNSGENSNRSDIAKNGFQAIENDWGQD